MIISYKNIWIKVTHEDIILKGRTEDIKIIDSKGWNVNLNNSVGIKTIRK